MLNFDEIVGVLDEQMLAQGLVSPAVKSAEGNALKGVDVMPGNEVVPSAQPGLAAPPEVQAPAPGSLPVDTAETEPAYPSFLDQINAVRQQKSGEWEAREKANRAKSALVGLTDGLSALANLIGATKGAASQPRQTAFPFLQQNIEQRRAEDRAVADRLRSSEMSYQQMLDRYAAQGALADTRLAQEKERTNRALGVQGMRNEQADKNNESKENIAKWKLENGVKLKEMDLKYKGDHDKMLADLKQQGINISRDRLDEMIRHNQTMDVIQEKKGSGSGNVGGYKVVITRDEYGREVSRERIPTTSGDTIDWGEGSDDNKIDW